MKLTKRLLAIVLAAAMLVGMVVISTSAVQLDDDVPTLTWDDCADINAETNPYTVKLGFKIYKVDTASGEYTLLADTSAGNDTYDVNVEAGDVLRVETWAQTNFHTSGIQLTPAYNNEWLLPTTMDYSVVTTTKAYPLHAATTASKVAMANAFPECESFCDEYGSGDGTMENPVFAAQALSQAKGQINHNSISGLRGVLPKDWQGTGTNADPTNAKYWVNKDAVDQWGNSIVDADGNFIYNVYQFGSSANSTSSDEWPGYTIILNVYQPVACFNLTVAEGAEGTAKLFFPLSSYYNTSNAYTSFTAVDYDKVQDSPNNNGNWDESMPQVATSGLTTYANKVTYSDGTVADKNWIVTNATITVGEGTTEEPSTEESTVEETTTEAPVEYADLTALQAAIAKAATADTTNCTSASVAAFEAALAAANALNVEGTLKSEQDAIDAAATRLENAITGLTKLGKCDYAALDTAIAEAATADTANCTSASVARFEAALKAANEVERDMIADEAGANQAKIDAAASELEAAIAGLTKLGKCDYTALDAAIAAYESKVADSYKYANWADYTALYEAAKAVTRDMIADEAGANQATIDAAAKALNDFALVEKTVDYTAWNAAVAKVPADVSAYTPASVEAFDAVVARAYNAKDAAVAAYDQAALDQAAADLEAAIELLVAQADKDALVAAIARASALSEDAYTPDSWTAAALATVLETANTVNADANATQDAVDNAVAAIEAAEAKLVVKADKDALATAIANAKALNEADYTPDSWTAAALATVIADAEAVYADGNATDVDVSAAIQALADATAALVKVADKTALKAAIDTLPAVAEEDAVPATWEAYTEALAEANEVYADANATQDAVDAAETALLAAIAGVQEKETVYCDYSDLDDAIAAFEALNADDYTPNSYNAVKAIYDAAKAVERGMEYTDENQTAIDEAYDALNNAMIRDLVKVADKTALKAAIDTVVDTANCTSASIAKYEAALAAANEVYADANATQDAVDAATDALVAAQALEKLPKVDYSDLEDAMAKFESLTESDWTADTWADAKAAYDAAADLLAQDLYDDEQYVNAGKVDAATDELNNAIAALKAAVNKDALLAEINKAASIEEDLATDATWAEYANALANAEDVYADDAATQDDVDTAEAELAAANAALETRGLVDYTALDAALALVPAESEDAYTAKSWQAYADAKAAAEAIARDLVDNKSGTNAKLVADAAAALEEAYAALKINAANVTNVEWDNTDYYVPGTLAYAFTVNEAASKIQVISPDGGTMTFDRRSSRVSIVSYNANGEVVDYADEDPAYEVWTINLVLSAGEYQVRTKYNYTWDTENYVFTVEYDEYDTKAAAFTATSGDVVDATEITVAAGDVITFKAVTDATALKVQFVFADGGTSTYSRGYAVDNGDGTLTWTITRVFAKSQDINLRVKAPTGWDTEFSGNVKVTIE